MVNVASAQRQRRPQVDELTSEIGQRIRAARLERGMSLADVGGKELTRSFLSLVELGRSRISLRALAIVADRLELPISYFLDSTTGMSDSLTELDLDQAEAALAQQEAKECLRILDDLAASEWLLPRVLWLRGRALIDAGRAREAVGVLEECLALAERRGGNPLKPQVHYTLGLALYTAGNYDDALVYLRQALEEASQGAEDPLMIGKANICMGHVMYVRGNAEAAIEYYARARDTFGSLSDLTTLGCVYSGLSAAYKRQGDLTSALRYSKLSVGAFQAQHNARLAANELNNLAVGYQELDDLEQALVCAREAVERARQVGARDIEAQARATLASIYLEQDDLVRAEQEARQAEERSENDADLARVDARIVLGEIAERNGDRARADTLYQQALDALRDSAHHAAYGEAALGYSLLLQRRGDTERALKFALEAAQTRASRTGDHRPAAAERAETA